MNKHHKYLLLVAFAQTAALSQAMELDTPNLEEVQDKFAILQTHLSLEEIQGLEATKDLILEFSNAPVIALNAHKAACALVHDGNPLLRDKSLLNDRKYCRSEVKKHFGKLATALLADDVSGSEDESETVCLAAAFDKVIKRVHMRDARLKSLTLEIEQFNKRLNALVQEENNRNLTIGRLITERNPLLEEKATLDSNEQEIRNLRAINIKTQAEAVGLQDWIRAMVNNEPLFEKLDSKLFVPPLEATLKAAEQEFDINLSKIIACLAATKARIKPLDEQEETLKQQQAQNRTIQADLERKLEALKDSTEYAQLERTKLFLALDQKLEQTVAQKNAIKQEIAEINALVHEQPSTIDKVSIKAQLPPKEALLLELQTLITHLKVAQAQADGSYTTYRWLSGYYN